MIAWLIGVLTALSFWNGLIVGLFIGVNLGILLAGLLSVQSRGG